MLPFLGLVWAVAMRYFFHPKPPYARSTCFELSRGAATRAVLYRCRSRRPCYAPEIWDSCRRSDSESNEELGNGTIPVTTRYCAKGQSRWIGGIRESRMVAKPSLPADCSAEDLDDIHKPANGDHIRNVTSLLASFLPLSKVLFARPMLAGTARDYLSNTTSAISPPKSIVVHLLQITTCPNPIHFPAPQQLILTHGILPPHP